MHNDGQFEADESMIQKILDEVELPGWMNIGLCYLKIGAYSQVLDMMNKVLEGKPDNVKALYWWGLAWVNMEDFDDAKKDLIEANRLCPNDKSIKDAFALYKEKKALYHKKSWEIAQQVFNKSESEEAMKEWMSFMKTERDKEEDIPGLLNWLIKFICLIPLLIYQYCFEKCFRGSLNFVSFAFSIVDKIPCFGVIFYSLRMKIAEISANFLKKFTWPKWD